MDQLWRVLIICSTAECRRRLADIIANWKLEVFSAATLQEAERILQQQDISLVFCEDSLADGRFRDLVKLLASGRSRIYPVALIHDEQQYGEVISVGAFDAIPIPYHPSDIGWIIFRAIHHAEESTRSVHP